MNKKYLYTTLIGSAIALSTIPLQAEAKSQQNTASNTIFVCAVQEQTPTMFAYTPGEVNLKPLMSWHSEYLSPGQSGQEICQRTANKLQASLEQEDAKFLKTYSKKATKSNLVCLVSKEDSSCTSPESEKLFSVNPNYSPSCILSNKKPIDCMALRVRGVYSYDEAPYKLLWWPW